MAQGCLSSSGSRLSGLHLVLESVCSSLLVCCYLFSLIHALQIWLSICRYRLIGICSASHLSETSETFLHFFMDLHLYTMALVVRVWPPGSRLLLLQGFSLLKIELDTFRLLCCG